MELFRKRLLKVTAITFNVSSFTASDKQMEGAVLKTEKEIIMGLAAMFYQRVLVA